MLVVVNTNLPVDITAWPVGIPASAFGIVVVGTVVVTTNL